MLLWDFHPNFPTPARGRQRAPFWICLPGSVTGICPCRMKACRAWLVTAPRGQTAHPKALSPSNQTRLLTVHTFKEYRLNDSPPLISGYKEAAFRQTCDSFCLYQHKCISFAVEGFFGSLMRFMNII